MAAVLASAFAGLALAFSPPPPEFHVSTLDGATVAFKDLQGKQVTVVAFVASKCPISHTYQERLNRIYREFSAKGVGFAVLNSNANESIAEIRKQVKEASLAFPVYKDFHNRAADLFDAQTTPEVFVLDSSGKVRYRGAIDDSANEARVKKHVLRNAIEAILAGNEPPVAELKAFGCVLKREKRTI